MSTKEFIRTIRNKIKFLGGITRSKIDAGKDTIGDLHNFKMETGSLVLREGTRVMNSQEDQLWYDIQSFTISGTKILIGINYKRELWAWLDKWPEIDFRLCTSSPYKRYRHVDENATEFFNRHISFSRGDNFWLDQDAYTIIIMSDQGEIYKIMKQGFVRITKDVDYVESGDDESISDLVTESREYDFQVGRIYVDIKDATNRVFEEKIYLPEDTQKKGHRITGEVRAAWVNELGVVSELSDPEYLSEYRHVMASLFSSIERNPKTNTIKANRMVPPDTSRETGHIIYKGHYDTDDDEFSIVPETSDPFVVDYSGYGVTTEEDAYAIILMVKKAGNYIKADGLGTEVAIPEGIYMCFVNTATEDQMQMYSCKEMGHIFQADVSFYTDVKKSFHSRIIEADVLSTLPRLRIARPARVIGATVVDGGSGYIVGDEITVTGGDFYEAAVLKVLTAPAGVIGSVESIPVSTGFYLTRPANPVGVTGGTGGDDATFNLVWEDSDPLDLFSKDCNQTTNNQVFIAKTSSVSGKWYKLDASMFDAYENIVLSKFYNQMIFSDVSGSTEIITFYGAVGVIRDFKVETIATGEALLSESKIKGIEFIGDTDSSVYQEYDCDSFDLWNRVGETEITASNINIAKKTAEIGSAEYIFNATSDEIEDFMTTQSRFAVWNNSHIIGVSQRCFIKNNSIFYEYQTDDLGTNYNLVAGAGVPFEIGYMPFMRFDYQGMRQIPYPLPLISRAMRNPEKALISAGNIYSLEDGKLWYGSSSDMLLKDSIEFQATVKNICAFDIGVIAATERGLQFVSKDGYKAVYRGEKITPDYLNVCSGGAIAVQGRKIYLIHKVITNSGSWYPQATEIGLRISDINLEGSLKSVSIGNVIYLADDHNVWGYDLDAQSWSLKYNYDTKIHKLFVFNDKLGLFFDAQIDRKKSFDAPEGAGVS